MAQDTQVWICPDRAQEDFFGGFRAERTMTIESTPGHAAASISVLGPKGGKRVEFRATPEWLRETGKAMIAAAELLRDVDDPDNFGP